MILCTAGSAGREAGVGDEQYRRVTRETCPLVLSRPNCSTLRGSTDFDLRHYYPARGFDRSGVLAGFGGVGFVAGQAQPIRPSSGDHWRADDGLVPGCRAVGLGRSEGVPNPRCSDDVPTADPDLADAGRGSCPT